MENQIMIYTCKYLEHVHKKEETDIIFIHELIPYFTTYYEWISV